MWSVSRSFRVFRSSAHCFSKSRSISRSLFRAKETPPVADSSAAKKPTASQQTAKEPVKGSNVDNDWFEGTASAARKGENAAGGNKKAIAVLLGSTGLTLGAFMYFIHKNEAFRDYMNENYPVAMENLRKLMPQRKPQVGRIVVQKDENVTRFSPGPPPGPRNGQADDASVADATSNQEPLTPPPPYPSASTSKQPTPASAVASASTDTAAATSAPAAAPAPSPSSSSTTAKETESTSFERSSRPAQESATHIQLLSTTENETIESFSNILESLAIPFDSEVDAVHNTEPVIMQIREFMDEVNSKGQRLSSKQLGEQLLVLGKHLQAALTILQNQRPNVLAEMKDVDFSDGVQAVEHIKLLILKEKIGELQYREGVTEITRQLMKETLGEGRRIIDHSHSGAEAMHSAVVDVLQRVVRNTDEFCRQMYRLRSKQTEEFYALQKDIAISKVSQEMERQTSELRVASMLEMQGLISRVDTLGDVLETQRQYQEVARTMQNVSFALLDLEASLETRKPIADTIDALRESAEKDAFIKMALESIPHKALSSGVCTKQDLLEQFAVVEDAAVEAALVPKNRSIWGFMLAKVSKFMLIRLHDLVPVRDDLSRLSRAGFFIEQGDVASAYVELKALSELPAEVCSDYLEDIHNRMLVEQTLTMVQSHISLLSKSWV